MFTTIHKTPPEKDAIGTTADIDGSSPLSPRMVNSACAAIFNAWRKHVSASEAQAEADRFRARFHFLIDGPLAPLSEAEADAVLDSVADAMAAP